MVAKKRTAKKRRSVRRKTRVMRGGELSVNASTPLPTVRKLIIDKYSDLLALKTECRAKCVSYICESQDSETCSQTTAMLESRPDAETSGFCHNMMAGFPKTCRIPTPVNPLAPYDLCACDRYKFALTEFEGLKRKLQMLAGTNPEWTQISNITAELFNQINLPNNATRNNLRKQPLTEEAEKFIRFLRQRGRFSLIPPNAE